MPFTYLEHMADVGIQASGSSLEEIFQDGAKAMLNVMWDISTISERQCVEIGCEARDIPELFVEALNEILFRQDVEGLAIGRFKVDEIKNINDRYRIKGTVYGEPLDFSKHIVKTEVKAATYAGLKFEQKDKQYLIQCILDV